MCVVVKCQGGGCGFCDHFFDSFVTKCFHICGTIWSNFEVPGGTFWYIFRVLGPFGPSLGAKVEKGLLLESILEGFWEALGT